MVYEEGSKGFRGKHQSIFVRYVLNWFVAVANVIVNVVTNVIKVKCIAEGVEG